MKKTRLDKRLVELDLAPDLRESHALILSGSVLVDDRVVDKVGQGVDVDSVIRLKSRKGRFVSRGGEKLQKALESFKIDCSGKICLDVGASTGGFTDCLLMSGAEGVYALDVGYGQLDWKLRNDDRVTVLDRMNIRKISFEDIGSTFDIIVVDASFISLKLVLPSIRKFTHEKGGTQIIALVKPQHEAEKSDVENGLVRDDNVRATVMKEIMEFSINNGYKYIDNVISPIRGSKKGNQEFLLYLVSVER